MFSINKNFIILGLSLLVIANWYFSDTTDIEEENKNKNTITKVENTQKITTINTNTKTDTKIIKRTTNNNSLKNNRKYNQ